MLSSCFCAPIHPPKFELGRAFIQTYNRFYGDSDIFLVFSSDADEAQFAAAASGLRYQSIVCTEPLGVSPITQKKYFGLAHIFANTRFQHVGVVDVDAHFISHLDYAAVFARKNANKTIWANLSKRDLMLTIAADSARLFSEADARAIREAIWVGGDTVRYFWFNDIPIYERGPFLQYLDYTWDPLESTCRHASLSIL